VLDFGIAKLRRTRLLDGRTSTTPMHTARDGAGYADTRRRAQSGLPADKPPICFGSRVIRMLTGHRA
jgi:hypothetical protein